MQVTRESIGCATRGRRSARVSLCRRGRLVAVVCVTVLLVAGCGVSGQGALAGAGATPGHVVQFWDGWLVNRSGADVTLRQLRLVAAKGYPLPRLVDVGVIGLDVYKPGQAPRRLAHPYTVDPHFIGFRVAPRQHAEIIIGLAGRRLGNYGVRGFDVSVAVGRAAETVWVPARIELCVRRRIRPFDFASCSGLT